MGIPEIAINDLTRLSPRELLVLFYRNEGTKDDFFNTQTDQGNVGMEKLPAAERRRRFDAAVGDNKAPLSFLAEKGCRFDGGALIEGPAEFLAAYQELTGQG